MGKDFGCKELRIMPYIGLFLILVSTTFLVRPFRLPRVDSETAMTRIAVAMSALKIFCHLGLNVQRQQQEVIGPLD